MQAPGQRLVVQVSVVVPVVPGESVILEGLAVSVPVICFRTGEAGSFPLPGCCRREFTVMSARAKKEKASNATATTFSICLISI